MRSSFHNTIDLKGPQLAVAEIKAKSQEELVEHYFITVNPFGDATACEVHEYLVKSELIDRNTPLTSIRRAITNLMNDRKLVMTENQRKGIFGKMNYAYKKVWAVKGQQQNLFQ